MLTVPTVADDVQYEYTSAQAIRGTEAKVTAKWAKDGWEVDSRNQGLLRTELTFRRVKPTMLGSRARAAFSRLEPKAQRGLLAASGAFVVLAIAGGVVAGVQANDGAPAPAASTAEAGDEAAPSRTPSEDVVAAPEATTPADPTIASPAPQAPTTTAPAPIAPKPQVPAPVAPQPQPQPQPQPEPLVQASAPAPAPEPPASTSTYFANCDAVRAAGADPIRSGDPGYSRKLDRDGDGIGCE